MVSHSGWLQDSNLISLDLSGFPLPKNWLVSKVTLNRQDPCSSWWTDSLSFNPRKNPQICFFCMFETSRLKTHQLHVFLNNIDLQHDYFCIASATTMLPCNIFHQRSTNVWLASCKLSLGQRFSTARNDRIRRKSKWALSNLGDVKLEH